MNVARVGVLTFHRCINYGSYWQAKCLVEGLRVAGYNAKILDHDSRQINIAEWKCAYQPNLPSTVIESDYPLYREKIEKFFQAFETLPLSHRFNINEPEQLQEYDAVIVGSDEVWNLFHPWYGKRALFYGGGIKAQRLISYAASFGNYPASWGLEQEWANRLQNFQSISVRDENSQTILENAIGVKPEMVLDPCLQFPIKADQSFNKFSKPYIAVYGHNFSDFFIREICRYAEEKKLPLISIGYRNDWADEQWITAGPDEFASFIAGAKAVATNFFHGCIFALQNEKPFVCETTPYRYIKIQGLMKKINGEKNLVYEETPFDIYDNNLSEPIDPEIVKNIQKLRERSKAFLDMALAINQLKVA